MIPLLMQEGYKAKGWLGLLMGTRMWYSFWGSEDDDEAAFEKRVSAVCREIGDRGKPNGQQPLLAPFPSLAPASQPALAPAPAVVSAAVHAAPRHMLAASTTPTNSSPVRRNDWSAYTPSVHSTTTRAPSPGMSGSNGASAEVGDSMLPYNQMGITGSSQLSEAFYAQQSERDRSAERERADRLAERERDRIIAATERSAERAERLERAERAERELRLTVALAVVAATAVVVVAVVLKR